MALVPGSRLGPYGILSAVGAGGMGEVYTPDGERFLVNLRPDEEVSDPMTLVQNWAAGRKQ
jgi:hypothetical protein